MVPEKENCIRIKKDICPKLGQLVKVEVVLWLGLETIISHLGVTCWLPGKVTLFWVKHCSFSVNTENLYCYLKLKHLKFARK